MVGAATRTLLLLALGAAPHALPEPLPGPDSPSTAWVAERLTRWPDVSAPQVSKDGNPLVLDCLLTPGQPMTVGMGQVMTIDAPLQDVAALVEDFPHYAALFPDLVDAHKVQGTGEGDRFVIAYEQRVPIFFVPNVRYQATWLVDRSSPKRVTYRYKLKEKGQLKATDGVIVLEALGPRQTLYSGYDFIDAAWGPLSEASAWEQTLAGTFRSDVAVKLKAESPSWSYEKVQREAVRLLERFPVEACFKSRHARDP